MFIGHFAVALAAKKAVPKVNLATLFAASQLADLLWPIFLLLGLEHVRIDVGNTAVTPLDFYDYPITHSLIGITGWSILFGGLYYFRRHLKNESFILAGVVFSHWILDFLTHRPDLPLISDTSVKFGLGLWNSFIGTLVVECGIFAAGAYLYISSTKPKNKTGTLALIGLLVFLAGTHLANLFMPPPSEVHMIAIAGNAMWLFVLWAWWIDRNRISVPV
jgi:hypothetical protein